MRLYVIGPVTWRENLNRAAFVDAKEKLEQAGYYVTIPHDIIQPGASRERAMRLSIGWIASLTGGVAMLDDWEKSPGATLENRVATACGLQVHCVGTWLRMAGVEPENGNSPEEDKDPPSDGTRAPSNEVSDALARRMDETNALLRAVYNQIAAVVTLQVGSLTGPVNSSVIESIEDTLRTTLSYSRKSSEYFEAAGKENADDREA